MRRSMSSRLGVAQVDKLSANDLVSDLYAVMGDILHQKNQKDAAFAAYRFLSAVESRQRNRAQQLRLLSERGRQGPAQG